MREDNTRSIVIRSYQWLLTMTLLLFGSSLAGSFYEAATANLQVKLSAKVKGFDNQGQPLIPTLLKIAADYHLPMGIQKVVGEALERPATIKLQEKTVADLLDLSVSQVPDYSTIHGEIEMM